MRIALLGDFDTFLFRGLGRPVSLTHVPRWMEKIVVHKAQHVISISQDVEDFLRESKSPARSYRIPNAMAPCFFEVEAAPREDGRHAVLYVGEIQKRKGLIYL